MAIYRFEARGLDPGGRTQDLASIEGSSRLTRSPYNT